MRGILKALTIFLLFFAVLVIVGLPLSGIFTGNTSHHHYNHAVSAIGVSHQQYFEHGLHDISFDFIIKRHLSTPPVLLKIGAVAVICLLFSLFCISSGLLAIKFFRFNFSFGKTPFQAPQLFLVLQTFLI
ncbi:hypothetical protein [Mucilaginibacter xinganensis]|uniref:Uncharacterized protein n=1 Tax=Mucilaginibacter xinganensis TaxID=1234841 RepID=A0A223NTQ9_9SPHI|nr:hypothetical protein [Mucilaginibacter xinganensis]ASU33064.1 hypothetical protein MuYL_1164 [Mucilaginibacter xinganensis]